MRARCRFVLSTGASLFNVCLNLLMMVVHSYVSLAITLPVFTALPQLALAAGVVLSAAVAHGTAVMQEALLFGVAHSYTPPPEVPWLLPARCPAVRFAPAAHSAMRDVKEVCTPSCVCRHYPSAFLCEMGGDWTYGSDVSSPSIRRISSVCGWPNTVRGRTEGDDA